MYNFTSFAMTLNELEPGMERLLAPTDCRLRPDIRAMENGDIGTTGRFRVQCCFSPCGCIASIVSPLLPDFFLQTPPVLKKNGWRRSKGLHAGSGPRTKRIGQRGEDHCSLAYHQDLLLVLAPVSS